MKRGFFITGTDTDVGKTTVALGLMATLHKKGFSVAAMKPVSAGCEQTPQGLRNEDSVRLMQQASVDLPYELVNPYAFAVPIAPHIAAEQSGITMQIPALLAAYQEIAQHVDVVIVEGAGGWLVPLNQTQTMADLAVALQLPVITVVGIRLGCLSHALLTQTSIKEHGLTQAGWVANHLIPNMPYAKENIDYLQQRVAGKLLGILPFKQQITIEETAACLCMD